MYLLTSTFKAIGIVSICLGTIVANAQGTQRSSPAVTGTTDWDQWKRNCSLFSDFRKKILDCATSAFRSRPFHFLAQTVVPGSGVGGGGRYTRDLNENGGAQDQLQATAVVTIRNFWFSELKFTSQRDINAAWNESGESLGLTAFVRNRYLPVMPFYGIGPNSSLNNSVEFSQRDTKLGVEVTTPVPKLAWLSAGAQVEGIWPEIGGVNNNNAISIEQEYTEETAPGLAMQPPFVHENFFLRPHRRFLKRFALNQSWAYNFYQDTDTGRYSFQRFEANMEQRFYPQRKRHGGVIEQNVLSLRLKYSISDTSRNHAVPFYLQETVGGSDIFNEQVLPAFKDYRFRGPDLFVVQAEYDQKICAACSICPEGITRTVCSHLGLVARYDAGNVGLHWNDFALSNLRQSYSGGVAIYLGKDVIFRMSVGLGGGEGAHPYFAIANVL